MFELALWKFKLDQVDEANPIPRKKCRMDVPGPVKDIILQYLRQRRGEVVYRVWWWKMIRDLLHAADQEQTYSSYSMCYYVQLKACKNPYLQSEIGSAAASVKIDLLFQA